MNTLDFARTHIRFDRASLISGAFDDGRYPHMRKPLAANDDLQTQHLVIYKAAGCMGTVYLQIVIAHHIMCSVGDAYFVAQDDDSAKTWGVSRGQGFILSIPDIWRLRRASIIERSCFTQDQWRFRHMDLYITGPSKSNRQSKQMRRVFTDESHLTDNYEDGALSEFDDRWQNWDWAGSSVHATTASDAGAEVDRMFYTGSQFEYHWKCPHCAKLIWPLWREVTPTQKHAEEVYGKDVFLWDERDTEDETLDTIRARCPHCDAIFSDTLSDRASLIGDDYVAMNANPKRGYDSYRWNVFALAHLEWRKVLALYRTAIEAAKLGNLALLENFAKKQLCASWTATLPNFGDGKGKTDYKIGDVWETGESITILTSDPQAGKGGEAPHRHALVTQCNRQGESRRLFYGKVDSAEQLHELALKYNVREGKAGQNPRVMVDSGYEPRRTFRECNKFGWYAYRGSDLQQFHTMKQGIGADAINVTFPMPYSKPEPQSGIVGEQVPKGTKKARAGALPDGWAFCIVGHNPELYGYLYALINGTSGRYFGIPSDMPDVYVKNMPAFIPILEPDKKTGTAKKVIWKKVREDHYWDLETMALTLAIREGFFPLAKVS